MDDGSHVLSSTSCPMAVKVHTDFIPGKTDTDFLKLEVSVHIYQDFNQIYLRGLVFQDPRTECLEHHEAWWVQKSPSYEAKPLLQ